jgi:acyl carrier protein
LPLYESVLVFENYPTGEPVRAPSGGTGFSFSGARTSRALSVVIMSGETLLIRAIHDRRRLDGVAVRRMLEHFERLLKAAMSDEAIPIARVTEQISKGEIPSVHPRVTGSAGCESMQPRTPLEHAVADIFREVLGIESLGLNDHFFVLGGHSLLATQLTSRINAAFEVDLPLRTVFESPTVAALAAAIDCELVRQVESLNDEELERLLATEAVQTSRPDAAALGAARDTESGRAIP